MYAKVQSYLNNIMNEDKLKGISLQFNQFVEVMWTLQDNYKY